MKNILFCGGDKRELPVMAALIEREYKVRVFGYPAELLPDKAETTENAAKAMTEADVCILPQTPIGADGRLMSPLDRPVCLTEKDLSALRKNTPVLCGAASDYLRKAAAHCRVIEMANDDLLATELAPASAEGAIAEALKLSGDILAGKRALIIGFGRIGREIAWRAEGMGMDTVVINRGRERAAEADDMGYAVVDFSQLIPALKNSDMVFNTAPALLINEEVLRLIHGSTCVVDVAAFPGGVDHEAAARLGMKTIHAGGLPGRYTPDYAGRKMSEYYPDFIDKLLKGGDS